jgi:protein-S-isoprenylcysteine O-methyltransferase Ste14
MTMMHVISSVAFSVFLLSLLTLGLTGGLFSAAPAVIACQACGFAVMLWGRLSFPKGSFSFGAKPVTSTIVKAGPYRFVRHPIYAGAMLVLWSSIAGHASVAHAAIGLAATLFVAGKIAHEERLLRASLPGYEEYARSTKTVIPFVL